MAKLGKDALVAAGRSALAQETTHGPAASNRSFGVITGTEFSVPTREIAVSRIRDNPYQPRVGLDREHVEGIAESIKATRLVQPILVREREDGDFELMEGAHRLEAHRLLNKDTILAVIRQVTDAEARIISLIGNVGRKDLADYELGRACVKALEEKAASSVSDLSRQLDISRQSIHRAIYLAELPQVVTEVLDRFPFALSGFYVEELRDLCGAGHSDVVAEAVRMSGEGKMKMVQIAPWVRSRIKTEGLADPSGRSGEKIETRDSRLNATLKARGRKLTVDLMCGRNVPDEMVQQVQERVTKFIQELDLSSLDTQL